MLSDTERQQIREEMQHYEHKRAACVEALKVVQQHRGWVSDESLRAVADLLEMTPDELDAVATFYNLIYRRPVGRHVILVCDSIACWIVGYREVLAHLQARLDVELGGTTADGQFTLLPVACLGACDRAPAMMVDDELYTDLDPGAIDRILDGYREGGD
jgi:NADH-quinone oxidoreductase subunit E